MERTTRRIGLTLVGLGLIILVGFPLSWRQIDAGLAAALGRDLAVRERMLITNLWIFASGACLLLGPMTLYLARRDRLSHVFALFTHDPLAAMRPLRPALALTIALPVVLGLTMWIIEAFTVDRTTALYNAYYYEGGLLERLTLLAMAAGSVILALTLFRWWRANPPTGWDRMAFAWLALFALAMFFWAGEEVSWGQRIIGWESPSWLAANDQGESNVHNLFSNYLRLMLRLMGLVPAAALLGIAIELGPRPNRVARIILPHASLLPGMALFSAIVIFEIWYMTEQAELLLSVICLLYSLRLWWGMGGQAQT